MNQIRNLLKSRIVLKDGLDIPENGVTIEDGKKFAEIKARADVQALIKAKHIEAVTV